MSKKYLVLRSEQGPLTIGPWTAPGDFTKGHVLEDIPDGAAEVLVASGLIGPLEKGDVVEEQREDGSWPSDDTEGGA